MPEDGTTKRWAAEDEPKSISTSTLSSDERDPAALGVHAGAAHRDGFRRLREHQLHARKCRSNCAIRISLPLRAGARCSAPRNWTPRCWRRCASCSAPTGEKGRAVRLLGCRPANWKPATGRWSCWPREPETRLKQAMQAVDALRDRFGESCVFAGQRNGRPLPRAYP